MKKLSAWLVIATLLLVSCGAPVTPEAPTQPPPTVAPTLAPSATLPPTVAATEDPTATAATSGTESAVTEAATTAATEAPTAVPDTATPAPTDVPAASPTPAVAYMTFQDFEIIPKSLTVTAGTKIVFLIKAGLLTFHQPYSSFPDNTDESGLFSAPPNMGDGTSYSVVLTQVGTITVRCGYHANDMVATITVTP
jgi:plastocyanin